MPVLLHQNLRRFCGEMPIRNKAYLDAFRRIANQLSLPGCGGPILAAGGTEIIDQSAGPIAWYHLSRALGLSRSFTVATGRSTLSDGMEFIGIGVHPLMQVLSVGRILICSSHGRIWLHHDIGDPISPAWCSRLPVNADLEFRTVVYVVISSPQIPPIAVGFLRDPFALADDTTAVSDKLPRILSTMRTNPAMAGGAGHVFLGGDFNQRPVNSGFTSDGETNVYEIAQGISPTDIHGFPNGVTPGGTKLTGQLHDYWYTNYSGAMPGPVFAGGVVPPVATVHVATLDTGPGMNGLMSDHAAAILRVG